MPMGFTLNKRFYLVFIQKIRENSIFHKLIYHVQTSFLTQIIARILAGTADVPRRLLRRRHASTDTDAGTHTAARAARKEHCALV